MYRVQRIQITSDLPARTFLPVLKGPLLSLSKALSKREMFGDQIRSNIV